MLEPFSGNERVMRAAFTPHSRPDDRPPEPLAVTAPRLIRRLVAALLLALCSACGTTTPRAGEPPAASGLRIEPLLSAQILGQYDDNIYLQNVGPLAKHDSWVTAVMPVAGISLRPREGTEGLVAKLSYEPDYRFFHSEPTESYLRHIGLLDIRWTQGPWSLVTQAKVAYTDGTTESVIWAPPDFIPSLGGYEVRDRRRNFKYQQRLSLRYDLDRWFLRGVYEGRVWDFMIEQKPIPFYQNFVDRNDLNAGADFGGKSGKTTEWFLGYRIGHQDQALNPFAAPLSYANTYHRVLLGVKTRAGKWLTLTGEAGPSLHEFDPAMIWPGQSDLETLLYFRTSATVTIGPDTTVTLGAREDLLPASVGRSAYHNIEYKGGIEHRFGEALRAGFTFTVEEYDFMAPIARRDRVYTPSLSAGYRFTPHFEAGLFYSYAWAESQVPNLEGREYDRHRIGFEFTASY